MTNRENKRGREYQEVLRQCAQLSEASYRNIIFKNTSESFPIMTTDIIEQDIAIRNSVT